MVDQRVRINPKVVPAEIDRWNWGAFLLSWAWGVGNNTFIALLTLIPFFGLIMVFVLGANGSAWAWRNGRWDSLEHFKRVQRLWAIWGAVVWLGAIVLFGGSFGGTFYFLRYSKAYELAASDLQASTEAANILGTPISTGLPSGLIGTTDGTGQAILRFSATGTKATGRVFVEAIELGGVWSLTRLTLTTDGKVIDLVKKSKVEIKSLAGEQKRSESIQSVTGPNSLTEPKRVRTITIRGGQVGQK
jgi:hypothetical protein